MSEQFKVGEIAIIQNQVGEAQYINGFEVEITGGLAFRRWFNDRGETGCGVVYEVKILSLSIDGAVFPASELRKKRPPTTGEQSIRDLFIQQDQPEEIHA